MAKSKKKGGSNTVIIFIVLGILLLIGAGIGGYFWWRSTQKSNGGTTGNNGFTGNTGTNGNTGVAPLTGSFTIVPVLDGTKALTFSRDTFNGPIYPVVDTIFGGRFCDFYRWTNESKIFKSTIVQSGLFLQGSPNIPSSQMLLLGNTTSSLYGFGTDSANLPNTTPNMVAWQYDAIKKTWCGGLKANSITNYCLYYDTTPTRFSMKQYVAGDQRFQWNNVTPVISPTCSSFNDIIVPL